MNKLLLCTLALAGLSSAALAQKAAPLNVATSFSILEDFVRNVGGSRVSVANLVPADGDAHTYEPSTADVRKLADARLIFVNGVGFESWLEKLVKNAGSKARVVTVSTGLQPRRFEEDGQLVDDPHMWWDLSRARRYVANIAVALTSADAAGKATYAANAARYTAVLGGLDAYAKKQVALIPAASRKLVTNHDALGYLADRYGLSIVGEVIPGGGTEQEASARELAALTEAIRREKVKAIFTENVLNTGVAANIARESGAKVAPPLYTDALGARGTRGETFAKAFRHNIDTIVAALR